MQSQEVHRSAWGKPLIRVRAYVDGFNLYFGLRSQHWRKYYWLDLPALVTQLLKPGQKLDATHYFTARIRSNGHNQKDAQRQNVYLDALMCRGVEIQEGHYLQKQRQCRECGNTWPDYEEKMTDVNIAVQLLIDAFDDHFDVALVLSGDSDLSTPIKRVLERYPDKRVIVVFPPKRHSAQLKRVASGYLSVGQDKLRTSQLPEKITKPDGHVLSRPITWK